MNGITTSGLESLTRVFRLLGTARQSLFGVSLLLLSATIGAGLAHADILSGGYRVADTTVTHHSVTLPQGVTVQTITLQMPTGVARVSLPAASGHESIVSNVQLTQSGREIVLSGWHAIRINSRSSHRTHDDGLKRFGDQNRYGDVARLQTIFLQEIRITLPHSAAGGSWDVRSLERELERLGVKVKPKPSVSKPSLPGPSLQRPTSHLSG